MFVKPVEQILASLSVQLDSAQLSSINQPKERSSLEALTFASVVATLAEQEHAEGAKY